MSDYSEDSLVNDPSNNDFFLASQFWVSGEMYKRRVDIVGFVNGLPLVFIELKASPTNEWNMHTGTTCATTRMRYRRYSGTTASLSFQKKN